MGVGVRWRYDDPNHGDHEPGRRPPPDVYAKADMALAKLVHDKLMGWYFHPGWYCEASHKSGIVKFNIPSLMGEQNWSVVRISDLEKDVSFKIVMRQAGNLLERFGIPRTIGFDESAFVAALARNPLGYLGKPNVSLERGM